MRVNMTINDELLARVDSYAKANYMTRSSVVGFACNQFLIANEMQSLLVEMKRAMQKIAESGSVDEEQQRKIDEFYTACNVLCKGGTD